MSNIQPTNNVSDDVSDDVIRNPDVSYEPKDVNPRSIAIFAIGLLVVIVAAMGLVWWILTSLDNRTEDEQAGQSVVVEVPPAPRLQPNPVDQIPPERQLELLRTYEEETLNSYGWVDKEAGIVRIPIDQAMKLVVEENQ